MNDIVQFVLKHGYPILFALFAHKRTSRIRFLGLGAVDAGLYSTACSTAGCRLPSSGLMSASGRHMTSTLRSLMTRAWGNATT